MSTEFRLRASDDDRDRLVEELQRHAADGRLSLDEYAERVDRVLVARTHGELAAVEEALAANGLGPLAVEISGQLTIGAGSLLAYGEEQQQRTFLPLVAEGRPMAFGLTEVGVGVNA